MFVWTSGGLPYPSVCRHLGPPTAPPPRGCLGVFHTTCPDVPLLLLQFRNFQKTLVLFLFSCLVPPVSPSSQSLRTPEQRPRKPGGVRDISGPSCDAPRQAACHPVLFCLEMQEKRLCPELPCQAQETGVQQTFGSQLLPASPSLVSLREATDFPTPLWQNAHRDPRTHVDYFPLPASPSQLLVT